MSSNGKHRKKSVGGRHRKPRPPVLPKVAGVVAPAAFPLALLFPGTHGALTAAQIHRALGGHDQVGAYHQVVYDPTLATTRATPSHVAVRPGDTLSRIAKREYGSARDWPALWWVNQKRVHNPNLVRVGEELRLSSWHPQRAWLTRRADAAVPKAPVPKTASWAPSVPIQTASSAQPAVSYSGGGIWGCISHFESGGNWSIDTGNGFYGGLQFTEGTWLAYGGGAFASYPNYASPGDQIIVAVRVQATGWNGNPPQGWRAWPVTSGECGV